MGTNHPIYITSSSICDQHKMNRLQKTHYLTKDTIASNLDSKK